MFKKMLVVSILFLSIVAYSNLTWATSCISPDGVYEITAGKMTFKVSLPGIVTMSLSFPNMGFLHDSGYTGGLFRFDNNGNFYLYISLSDSDEELEPVMTGTWDMTPWCSTKFAVDFDMESTIQQLLGSLSGLTEYDLGDIGEYIEITKNSLTGTINTKNKNISGKFALTIDISVEDVYSGAISFSGSYTAVPSTHWGLASLGSSLSRSKGKASSAQKNPVAVLIPNLMQLVPIKKTLTIK